MSDGRLGGTGEAAGGEGVDEATGTDGTDRTTGADGEDGTDATGGDDDTEAPETADYLRVLGREYSAAIVAAADEPTTAKRLSEEVGVPIATCHRRLDELCRHDLVAVHDSVLVDGHHRATRYRRTVDDLRIEFGGTPTLRVRDAPADGRPDAVPWAAVESE
jgi:hypothetical protein